MERVLKAWTRFPISIRFMHQLDMRIININPAPEDNSAMALSNSITVIEKEDAWEPGGKTLSAGRRLVIYRKSV